MHNCNTIINFVSKKYKISIITTLSKFACIVFIFTFDIFESVNVPLINNSYMYSQTSSHVCQLQFCMWSFSTFSLSCNLSVGIICKFSLLDTLLIKYLASCKINTHYIFTMTPFSLTEFLWDWGLNLSFSEIKETLKCNNFMTENPFFSSLCQFPFVSFKK